MENINKTNFLFVFFLLVIFLLPFIYNYPLYLKITQITLGIGLMSNTYINNNRIKLIIQIICITIILLFSISYIIQI